jgi:hypothetical protein
MRKGNRRTRNNKTLGPITAQIAFLWLKNASHNSMSRLTINLPSVATRLWFAILGAMSFEQS